MSTHVHGLINPDSDANELDTYDSHLLNEKMRLREANCLKSQIW